MSLSAFKRSLKPPSSKPPYMTERYFTTFRSYDTLLEMVLHRVLTDCLRYKGSPISGSAAVIHLLPHSPILLSTTLRNTISMPAEAQREMELCSCCLAVLFPGGLARWWSVPWNTCPSTSRSCGGVPKPSKV